MNTVTRCTRWFATLWRSEGTHDRTGYSPCVGVSNVPSFVAAQERVRHVFERPPRDLVPLQGGALTEGEG